MPATRDGRAVILHTETTDDLVAIDLGGNCPMILTSKKHRGEGEEHFHLAAGAFENCCRYQNLKPTGRIEESHDPLPNRHTDDRIGEGLSVPIWEEQVAP